MALGMKIKEKMIREFTPSQEDITEIGKDLDEIKELVLNLRPSGSAEEGKILELIGGIKYLLGLTGRY